MSTSNVLYLADTPIQVTNCIALASGYFRPGQTQADSETLVSYLVIYAAFSDSERFFELAVKSAVFEEVYLLEDSRHENSKLGLRLNLLRAVLGDYQARDFPRWVSSVRFDWIGLSSFTLLHFCALSLARKLNPDIKIFMFEDGTGSYNGEVFRCSAYYFEALPKKVPELSAVVKKKRRLARFLFGKRASCNLNCIYVKHPALISYTPPCDVRSFSIAPLLDIAGVEAFAPELQLPRNQGLSVLFLEPPRGAFDQVELSALDSLMKSLDERGIWFGRRAHPRSRREGERLSRCVDVSEGQWELICHRSAFKRVVLVGQVSTTMLSPVMEAGEKPYLMFLHHLSRTSGPGDSEVQRQIIELISKLYGKDDSRIIIPESLDEASSILLNLCMDPVTADADDRGAEQPSC